jgi:hypothetical protein
LLFVIITAVCQIICLNKALVCADTVVVVPLFYAGKLSFPSYQIEADQQATPSWGEFPTHVSDENADLSFINSLIFYDEAGQYERWVREKTGFPSTSTHFQVLVMVFLSIAVLISGVVLLSLKSSAKSATDPYTVSARPTSSMRMNPRSRVVSKQSNSGHDDDEERDQPHGSPLAPKDEVMWEVGSVSDDEDTGAREQDEGNDAGMNTKQGLGEGSGRGRGERRGLLDDDEDGEGEALEHERTTREKEDEDFGEYEAVRRTSLDVGPSGNK